MKFNGLENTGQLFVPRSLYEGLKVVVPAILTIEAVR